MPEPSTVCGIEDRFPRGDEEGAVVRVGMHGIGDERLRVLNLLPGVTFVARLPNLPVPELNEQGLEKLGIKFKVEKQ